jgi:hypothetical protein
VGESLPGWRACSRLTRKLGPKVEEVAATERPKGAFLLLRRVVRRSVSPQKGEKKLKLKLARRREDEKPWLFEM